MNRDIATAQQQYDLNKAAELQYGKLPQLQKQLEAEEEKVKNQDLSLVHESVTEDEIARIISRWTGIPVSKLNESERSKILHLDTVLHKLHDLLCHKPILHFRFGLAVLCIKNGLI